MVPSVMSSVHAQPRLIRRVQYFFPIVMVRGVALHRTSRRFWNRHPYEASYLLPSFYSCVHHSTAMIIILHSCYHSTSSPRLLLASCQA